ncbi:Holliday junction branch migration protein RuvA [Sulfurospirillum arcachonense]|uniref:Holliday junction branch migration protein RuvA n=1 Tax=Sulfurospirillum arcachonense TaxID=57666 RepID=UPI00046A68F5|nr:Holliday junction branch migration protein RuvA [Sulfurospirillum arcachonense]
MIIAIEGKIVKKEPTFLHVKTNSGFTYKVHVSLFCSSEVELGDISLYVTQIIREDANNLYGFKHSSEKKVFDTLVKVNGVGPSTALAVCSTLSPSEFANALTSNSIEAFKKVPGIGPKSAKRILVELSDFSLESDDLGSTNGAVNETIMALESLGFKKDRIKKVLSTCIGSDTSSLIKEALKKLG